MLMSFNIDDAENIMRLLVEEKGFNLDCFETDDVMYIGEDLDDIITIVNTMVEHGFRFTLSRRV